jgi:hypothetical protein
VAWSPRPGPGASVFGLWPMAYGLEVGQPISHANVYSDAFT